MLDDVEVGSTVLGADLSTRLSLLRNGKIPELQRIEAIWQSGGVFQKNEEWRKRRTIELSDGVQKFTTAARDQRFQT